jgi:hypothetical protein
MALMDVPGRHWEILYDVEFVELEAGHGFIECFQCIIFTQVIDHSPQDTNIDLR